MMEEDEELLPIEYKGEVLDLFLSKGWFRALAHGVMFTTSFLENDGVKYPVHWLRYDLSRFHFGASQRRLLKKIQNSGFVITCESFRHDQELEALFEKYKTLASFTFITTIEETFDGMADYGLYDSIMLQVRNGEQLIAVGLFDKGEDSISPILNYFDPEYKQYGLGKFLLMLEIEYALQKNIKYVYPGYIAPGIDKFNFKLFPDKNATELYLENEETWIDYVAWLRSPYKLI